MHIGVTATRWGATEQQLDVFSYIFTKLKGKWLHQGMCEGGDTQAHDLIRETRGDGITKIKGHPSLDKGHEVARDCEEMAEPKGHLDRNRDIVDESDVMIAMPHTAEEQKRGGTWYTIRHAKKVIKADNGMCKKLYIIKPDGKVDYFDKDKL